jgi:hypothetical protein
MQWQVASKHSPAYTDRPPSLETPPVLAQPSRHHLQPSPYRMTNNQFLFICILFYFYVFSPLRLDYSRLPHAYVNQTLKIQLELLMMSGVPLETC